MVIGFSLVFHMKPPKNINILSHLCSQLLNSTFKVAKNVKNGQKCYKKKVKNGKITLNWPFFHQFWPPMSSFLQWISGDIKVLYPFSAFRTSKNLFLGEKGEYFEMNNFEDQIL